MGELSKEAHEHCHEQHEQLVNLHIHYEKNMSAKADLINKVKHDLQIEHECKGHAPDIGYGNNILIGE
tara:strand:- start:1031 stop:1234 length:204 start_codon:yes stop_codon:yes gene_type:complete